MNINRIAITTDFVVENRPRREIRHVQNIVAHDAAAFANAHQGSRLQQRNILESRNILLVKRLEFRHHLAAGDQMLRHRLLVQSIDSKSVAHVAARRMFANAEHAGMMRIVHREDSAVLKRAHQLLMDVHGILLTFLIINVAPQAAERSWHRFVHLHGSPRPCADVAVARAIDDHFRLDCEKAALRVADQLLDFLPFLHNVNDLRHERHLHASLCQQLVIKPFHQFRRAACFADGRVFRAFHVVELVVDFAADTAREEVHAIAEHHEHRHKTARSHAAETGLAFRQKNAFARTRRHQRGGDARRTSARHKHIDGLTDFDLLLIHDGHGRSFAALPDGLFFY